MEAKFCSLLSKISTSGMFQLKKYSKKENRDNRITKEENSVNPQKNALEERSAIFFIIKLLIRFLVEFQCLFLQFSQK